MKNKLYAPLILASASPRRLDLLGQIGVKPDRVEPANIDEAVLKKEKPTSYVQRLAQQKALAVVKHNPNNLVLAADTIVVQGCTILGKAHTSEQAKQYLSSLQGRRHRVYTAVGFYTPHDQKLRVKTSCTHVKFKQLHPTEINHYLTLNEWQDKAGAYSIQGFAACFVEFIRGSYSNVVGLPLDIIYKFFLNRHILLHP